MTYTYRRHVLVDNDIRYFYVDYHRQYRTGYKVKSLGEVLKVLASHRNGRLYEKVRVLTD